VRLAFDKMPYHKLVLLQRLLLLLLQGLLLLQRLGHTYIRHTRLQHCSRGFLLPPGSWQAAPPQAAAAAGCDAAAA
jgi:hypothetical protein